MTTQDAMAGYDPAAETTVDGWVAFAGAVMLLLSVLNGIEGIAAISNSQFFGRGSMMIGDLQFWGWVLAGIGIAQLLIAPWLWLSIPLARMAAVLITAIDAIVQLLVIPAYPFWSLSIFALNLLVLFALVARHGARRA